MVILIKNFENLKQNRIFFQSEKSEIGKFKNTINLYHLNYIWENFEQHLFWQKKWLLQVEISIKNFENLKQNRIFFLLEKSEFGIFQN